MVFTPQQFAKKTGLSTTMYYKCVKLEKLKH